MNASSSLSRAEAGAIVAAALALGAAGASAAGLFAIGTVAGVGAAVEELFLEPQALGEAQHDVGVAARFTPWRDHGLTQLHAFQGSEAGIEAGAQPLAFP